MAFTKQGSDLTNIGTSLPLPLVLMINVRAGVAMVQSSLEGESFCYSRQGSSHIPAQPCPKGECWLLVVWWGVLVQ